MRLIGGTHVLGNFLLALCQIAILRHTFGMLVTFMITHLPFKTLRLLLDVPFAKFVSGLYCFPHVKN